LRKALQAADLFSCGGAQLGIPNWYPLVGIFSALVCSNLETCAEVVRGHLTGMGTSAYQWLCDNNPIVIPIVIEPNPGLHFNAMNLKQRGNGPGKAAHQPGGAGSERFFALLSVGLYRLIKVLWITLKRASRSNQPMYSNAYRVSFRIASNNIALVVLVSLGERPRLETHRSTACLSEDREVYEPRPPAIE
jgi:hypothetical protein